MNMIYDLDFIPDLTRYYIVSTYKTLACLSLAITAALITTVMSSVMNLMVYLMITGVILYTKQPDILVSHELNSDLIDLSLITYWLTVVTTILTSYESSLIVTVSTALTCITFAGVAFTYKTFPTLQTVRHSGVLINLWSSSTTLLFINLLTTLPVLTGFRIWIVVNGLTYFLLNHHIYYLLHRLTKFELTEKRVWSSCDNYFNCNMHEFDIRLMHSSLLVVPDIIMFLLAGTYIFFIHLTL